MLTVAIPTYNRAERLDQQLTWLACALARLDARQRDRVDVVISDNASTDHTSEVVERWRPALEVVDFTYRRNHENIGAVPNIASCIQSTARRHVWTIGDDDRMDDDALAVVLGILEEAPDVGLLTLNFSSRYVTSGLQRFARCYPIEATLRDPAGIPTFTSCLDLDEGGVALTTAQVYRADLAREAQERWPRTDNLVVQIYWSAYCAARGGMYLTADTHLECAAGTHFFVADPSMELRLHLVDTPELGNRLTGLGYDRRICAELTLKQLAPRTLRTARAALRSDRRVALHILAAYARAVSRAGLLRAVGFVVRGLIRRWQTRGQLLDRGRPSESG